MSLSLTCAALCSLCESNDLDSVVRNLSAIRVAPNRDSIMKKLQDIPAGTFSAAHWACFNDNAQLLSLLFKNGFNMTVVTKGCIKHPKFGSISSRCSLLHACCIANAHTCAQVLLDLDIDCNVGNTHGLSPIFVACLNKSVDTLSLVASHPKHKPDFTKGTPSALPASAEHKIAISKGCTPLMISSAVSDACTRVLLKEFADHTIKDEYGYVAAHYACQYGNLKTLQILIAAKADVDARSTKMGTVASMSTPLHVAVRSCPNVVDAESLKMERKIPFIQCVNLLLTSRCNPNAVDSRGWTVAHHCCMQRDDIMLKAIIVTSASLCTQAALDPTGSTVASKLNLMLGSIKKVEATIAGNVEIIKEGSTAYQIAASRAAYSCAEMIVDVLRKDSKYQARPKDPLERFIEMKLNQIDGKSTDGGRVLHSKQNSYMDGGASNNDRTNDDGEGGMRNAYANGGEGEGGGGDGDEGSSFSIPSDLPTSTSDLGSVGWGTMAGAGEVSLNFPSTPTGGATPMAGGTPLSGSPSMNHRRLGSSSLSTTSTSAVSGFYFADASADAGGNGMGNSTNGVSVGLGNANAPSSSLQRSGSYSEAKEAFPGGRIRTKGNDGPSMDFGNADSLEDEETFLPFNPHDAYDLQRQLRVLKKKVVEQKTKLQEKKRVLTNAEQNINELKSKIDATVVEKTTTERAVGELEQQLQLQRKADEEKYNKMMAEMERLQKNLARTENELKAEHSKNRNKDLRLKELEEESENLRHSASFMRERQEDVERQLAEKLAKEKEDEENRARTSNIHENAGGKRGLHYTKEQQDAEAVATAAGGASGRTSREKVYYPRKDTKEKEADSCSACAVQ